MRQSKTPPWGLARAERWALGAAGALAGTTAACVAWGSLVERHLYALRRFSVPVLAPGALPIRVLHISDLHLIPRQRHRMQWVHDLAALEPDLVVNTGDNLAALDAVPAVLETFHDLLGFPGVFVLGSNDYYAPGFRNPFAYLTQGPSDPGARRHQPDLPWQEMVAGFTHAGWHDLTNTRARLELAGVRVDFLGVDDPHLGFDRYDDLPAAPTEPAPADLTIGVTHAPYQRILNAMSSDGAELILAGHTHGGQVCVPGFGALVTNCDLDTARAKGLSRWWPGAGATPSRHAPTGAAWLEVSAGLGHSPSAPYRFACRPEATLLTLVPRDADTTRSTRDRDD